MTTTMKEGYAFADERGDGGVIFGQDLREATEHEREVAQQAVACVADSTTTREHEVLADETVSEETVVTAALIDPAFRTQLNFWSVRQADVAAAGIAPKLPYYHYYECQD